MRPRRLINFCDIDGGSRESTPVTLRADEWPVMMGHELCFKAYVDLSANTAGKNDGPATRSTRNGRVCYGTPLAALRDEQWEVGISESDRAARCKAFGGSSPELF